MSTAYEHRRSAKAEAFLASVQNGKYDRQIITGLQKFFDGRAPADMIGLYSPNELQSLRDLKGTVKDVDSLKVAFDSIQAKCTGCHDDYRVKLK